MPVNYPYTPLSPVGATTATGGAYGAGTLNEASVYPMTYTTQDGVAGRQDPIQIDPTTGLPITGATPQGAGTPTGSGTTQGLPQLPGVGGTTLNQDLIYGMLATAEAGN